MKVKLFFAILCMLFLASCSSSRKTFTKKKNNVKIQENPINKLPSVRQQQHVKKLEKGNKPLNKYTLQIHRQEMHYFETIWRFNCALCHSRRFASSQTLCTSFSLSAK